MIVVVSKNGRGAEWQALQERISTPLQHHCRTIDPPPGPPKKKAGERRARNKNLEFGVQFPRNYKPPDLLRFSTSRKALFSTHKLAKTNVHRAEADATEKLDRLCTDGCICMEMSLSSFIVERHVLIIQVPPSTTLHFLSLTSRSFFRQAQPEQSLQIRSLSRSPLKHRFARLFPQ